MSVSPMRSWDETITLVSKWDIGATGAHTKSANCAGTGFASVARTATGRYTITFARGLPVGPLLELRVFDWSAATVESFECHPVLAGYTKETAGAAATMLYESWDKDTTALTELASGDQVSIVAVFQKTI